MRNESEKSIEIKEKIIEKIKYSAGRLLAKKGSGIQELEVVMQDFDYGMALGVALHGNILSETLCDEDHVVSFDFPVTWWQHFKKEMFPYFLLKRFPVVYGTKHRKFKFKREVLWPELFIPFKGERTVIKEAVCEEYGGLEE